MKQRVNIIACALVVSALGVPAVHAGDRHSPGAPHQASAALVRTNAFANLGHEGSGLTSITRKNTSAVYAFANLGHEGSGLTSITRKNTSAVHAFANLGHEGSGLTSITRKNTSAVHAFANLGHEGSGLTDAWEAARLRPWAQ